VSLDLARAVADAVLYEGYLLYPYRATSRKNQVRWQFGVLGPVGAAVAGVGEEPAMAVETLLSGAPDARVTGHLRFLQLQLREAQCAFPGLGPESFSPVEELTIGSTSWLTWDEAVPHEVALATCRVGDLDQETVLAVDVPGGEDVEELSADDGSVVGRLVRRRWPLSAEVRLSGTADSGATRLRVAVDNVTATAGGPDKAVLDKDGAIRQSFIGAHLLLVAEGAEFVSLLDPPDGLAEAAGRCEQHRCWPVLAGPRGSARVVLGSPIILYDHPEVAEQSAGELFDSTEIDEILTLRVMTLTDQEKAEARATDPRAAQIIDRCEQMTPQQMQQLHGILRDVDLAELADLPVLTEPPDPTDLSGTVGFTDEVPWWDPAVDGDVQPETDVVMISGLPVSSGSLVRIHPSRRADAHDMFFADQEARVTAVHRDVDGNTHVAVVLRDDPAADMHEWYGRYLYFAPDELEPLPPDPP